jgi:transposase
MGEWNGVEERIRELEAALAERDARIAQLEAQLAERDARIEQLARQVAELAEQLGRNSRNSHLPPSADSPKERKGRKGGSKRKRLGKRKRGGQAGHRGTHRVLLPPEQVDEFVNLFPKECENCWKPLPGVEDPCAWRYQTTELPPIRPHTTEFRRHTVKCPGCEHKTCAPYDAETIPASPFGPRLMAVMALLTGAYHLSRR